MDIALEIIYSTFVLGVLIIILFYLAFAFFFGHRRIHGKLEAIKEKLLEETSSRIRAQELINLNEKLLKRCEDELKKLEVFMLSRDQKDSKEQSLRNGIVYNKVKYLHITPEPQHLVSADLTSLYTNFFDYRLLSSSDANKLNIINELELNKRKERYIIHYCGVVSDQIDLIDDGIAVKTNLDWLINLSKRYEEIKLLILPRCSSLTYVNELNKFGFSCVLGFRESLNKDLKEKTLRTFLELLIAGKSAESTMSLLLLMYSNELESNVLLRGDFSLTDK